jgi:hypothetical protein
MGGVRASLITTKLPINKKAPEFQGLFVFRG